MMILIYEHCYSPARSLTRVNDQGVTLHINRLHYVLIQLFK
jgi:hypothetical protein